MSGDRAGSRDTVSLLEQIDLWLVGNEEMERKIKAKIEDHKRAVSSCLVERVKNMCVTGAGRTPKRLMHIRRQR